MTRSGRKEDAIIRQTFFLLQKCLHYVGTHLRNGTLCDFVAHVLLCFYFPYSTVYAACPIDKTSVRVLFTVPRGVACPPLSLPLAGGCRFPRQRETPGGKASACGVALRLIGRSGGDSVTGCGFRSKGGWAYYQSLRYKY